MNKTVLSLLALSLASTALADDIVIPDSTGFKFTDVKVIKSTPVRAQNKAGKCWAYSSTSFFED